MKLTALTLSLSLVACAHGVVDEEPTQSEEPQLPAPRYDNPEPKDEGYYALPCDRRERHEFEIDGKRYVLEVPTLCDPTPYIEKGDPAPWARSEKSE
jgi:hypothetical protein